MTNNLNNMFKLYCEAMEAGYKAAEDYRCTHCGGRGYQIQAIMTPLMEFTAKHLNAKNLGIIETNVKCQACNGSGICEKPKTRKIIFYDYE